MMLDPRCRKVFAGAPLVHPPKRCGTESYASHQLEVRCMSSGTEPTSSGEYGLHQALVDRYRSLSPGLPIAHGRQRAVGRSTSTARPALEVYQPAETETPSSHVTSF